MLEYVDVVYSSFFPMTICTDKGKLKQSIQASKLKPEATTSMLVWSYKHPHTTCVCSCFMAKSVQNAHVFQLPWLQNIIQSNASDFSIIPFLFELEPPAKPGLTVQSSVAPVLPLKNDIRGGLGGLTICNKLKQLDRNMDQHQIGQM